MNPVGSCLICGKQDELTVWLDPNIIDKDYYPYHGVCSTCRGNALEGLKLAQASPLASSDAKPADFNPSTTLMPACLYPVFDDSGRDVGCDRFAVATYKDVPVCIHHAEIVVRESGGFLWINAAEHRVEPTRPNVGDLPAIANQSKGESPA